MKRIVCFWLIIEFFLLFSNILGNEPYYPRTELESAKNKLETFLKNNPKSFFETDARLKLAEVSFYLAEPLLSQKIPLKSFLIVYPIH